MYHSAVQVFLITVSYTDAGRLFTHWNHTGHQSDLQQTDFTGGTINVNVQINVDSTKEMACSHV